LAAKEFQSWRRRRRKQFLSSLLSWQNDKGDADRNNFPFSRRNLSGHARGAAAEAAVPAASVIVALLIMKLLLDLFLLLSLLLALLLLMLLVLLLVLLLLLLASLLALLLLWLFCCYNQNCVQCCCCSCCCLGCNCCFLLVRKVSVVEDLFFVLFLAVLSKNNPTILRLRKVKGSNYIHSKEANLTLRNLTNIKF